MPRRQRRDRGEEGLVAAHEDMKPGGNFADVGRIVDMVAVVVVMEMIGENSL